MKKILISFLSVISLLLTTAHAGPFLGSDNFNAAGPLDTSNWNLGGGGQLFIQTNGQAQFNANNYNTDALMVWRNTDASASLGYDWNASVSATLYYDGSTGSPALGLYANPLNQFGGTSAFFGIMLRGGRPTGTTDVFSSYGTSVGASAIDGFGNTVGVGTAATNNVTDVLLRIGWNNASGNLTTSYSFDGGATNTTLASINASSLIGYDPSAFRLSLYAFSGSSINPAGSMYFDNFSVSSSSSTPSVPDSSSTALLVVLAALGLIGWRRHTLSVVTA